MTGRHTTTGTLWGIFALFENKWVHLALYGNFDNYYHADKVVRTLLYRQLFSPTNITVGQVTRRV
jgi:hypothetical protein